MVIHSKLPGYNKIYLNNLLAVQNFKIAFSKAMPEAFRVPLFNGSRGINNNNNNNNNDVFIYRSILKNVRIVSERLSIIINITNTTTKTTEKTS